MTLPNFFLIGTQKGGTTSVYHYLDQHSEIFMCPEKEPFYFMAEGMENASETYITDLNEYASLFTSVRNEKAIGEATTLYLSCPWVPGRIRETIGSEVKFIAILRNPVERAWSHYLMHARKGHPMFSEDFGMAIQQNYSFTRNDEVWEMGFYNIGLYSEQLKRYFQHFDRENFLILLFDDLRKDVVSFMQSIYSFLELENTGFIPDTARRYNEASYYKHKSQILDRFLNKKNLPRSVTKKILGNKGWNNFSQWMNAKNTEKPVIDPKIRKQLNSSYSNEIKELESMLGRDLSSWLD